MRKRKISVMLMAAIFIWNVKPCIVNAEEEDVRLIVTYHDNVTEEMKEDVVSQK